MKKVKKILFLMLLIAFCGFLYNYGIVFAKYVSNFVWDIYLQSKGFYFNSNQLGSSSVTQNVDNLWDGGSVHFDLNNNLNQNVITEYNIEYTTTCTVVGDAASYTTCHINGTESNVVDDVLNSNQNCVNNTTDEVDVSSYNKDDCKLGGYDWTNNIVTKDHYFDIILTDNNYKIKNLTVNVTITSTSPYRKILSGDFVLHKVTMEEDNLFMDYKNYSNYDRLNISNSYSDSKCVKVKWDSSKLIIDADNSEFSSHLTDANGYINEITFNIAAKANLSYIFYKRDFDMTYDVSEFTIEETEGC